MDKIKGLKEDLQRNWNEANSYYDKAEKDGRKLLDHTEKEAFDRIMADSDNIEANIKALEKLQENEASRAETFGAKAETLKMGSDEHNAKHIKAFGKYLRSQPMTAEEKGFMTRGTNTQIASTTTLGGFLVPEEWQRRIDVARKHVGSIKNICTNVNTMGGGVLPWPKVDDSTNSGAGIQTEGSAPAVNDLTFGETQLSAYTYTSGIIKVSFQLLQDEDVDLVPLVGELAGMRLERAQSAHFVSGDASSKPDGFITAIDPYNAGGDGGSLTSDVIYDLVASVDVAYQANSHFVFSPATLGTIKKLSVGTSDNRPLWVPGLAQGEPSTIDGSPYLVCADMADEADAAKYMAYGDFSKYVVRTVGGMNLMRMDERFADALVTGFLGYERVDGQYVGADTGAIKYAYRTAT